MVTPPTRLTPGVTEIEVDKEDVERVTSREDDSPWHESIRGCLKSTHRCGPAARPSTVSIDWSSESAYKCNDVQYMRYIYRNTSIIYIYLYNIYLLAHIHIPKNIHCINILYIYIVICLHARTCTCRVDSGSNAVTSVTK